MIDKSKLPFGIRSRNRDRAYLDTFKDSCCVASDNGIDQCEAPSVPAHVRIYHEGGSSLKPDDELTVDLCQRHHDEQGANEEWFWIQKVMKPMLRRKYRNYLTSKGRHYGDQIHR